MGHDGHIRESAGIERGGKRHGSPSHRPDCHVGSVDPQGLTAHTEGMSGADIAEVLRRIQHSTGVQYADTDILSPITQEDIIRSILRMRAKKIKKLRRAQVSSRSFARAAARASRASLESGAAARAASHADRQRS